MIRCFLVALALASTSAGDSKYAFPKHRLSLDLPNYITEKISKPGLLKAPRLLEDASASTGSMIASVIDTPTQIMTETQIVNSTEDQSIVSIMEEILNLDEDGESRASDMLCNVSWEHEQGDATRKKRKMLWCQKDIDDLKSVVFQPQECDLSRVFCGRVLSRESPF